MTRLMYILVFLSAFAGQLLAEPPSQERFASPNPITQVAAALQVPVAVVKDIRTLNLDPYLSWILMKVSAAGNVSGAQLLKDRATRSWGEVVMLYGLDWVGVNGEMRDLLSSGALVLEQPTVEQMFRTASNRPNARRPSKPMEMAGAAAGRP
jgi:hypothetical protein